MTQDSSEMPPEPGRFRSFYEQAVGEIPSLENFSEAAVNGLSRALEKIKDWKQPAGVYIEA